MRAAVMPHPFQPGAGEHSTHRPAASRSDQANNETGERAKGRRGEARPEHREQIGQRTRYRAVGKHRRITLTRVVQTPSMLSSSPFKIHESRITGVSPRPAGRRPAPAKLRNTRSPVGAEKSVTLCDLQVFMYEATEPVSSQRPDGRSGVPIGAASGRLLMERS